MCEKRTNTKEVIEMYKNYISEHEEAGNDSCPQIIRAKSVVNGFETIMDIPPTYETLPKMVISN